MVWVAGLLVSLHGSLELEDQGFSWLRFWLCDLDQGVFLSLAAVSSSINEEAGLDWGGKLWLNWSNLAYHLFVL